MTTTAKTTAALKRKSDHDDVFINILNAVNDSIGKGTEFNNNLIDDPGATLANIVTKTRRCSYSQTKYYLELLAVQGFVTINVYQRKRARKKGRDIQRQSTVTIVKITDKGYKYLLLLSR
jgi:hypothetical protein